MYLNFCLPESSTCRLFSILLFFESIDTCPMFWTAMDRGPTRNTQVRVRNTYRIGIYSYQKSNFDDSGNIYLVNLSWLDVVYFSCSYFTFRIDINSCRFINIIWIGYLHKIGSRLESVYDKCVILLLGWLKFTKYNYLL